ncbi:MAG: arginine--tRNA ligase [Chthoniobacterales bacterium]|nr:arginine--tRNA ligase [Chthoniobacterales bacterium]
MNTTPQAELTRRLRAALAACGLPPERGDVVAAADTRFGDYQANAAMVLAKEAKANPRQLAAQISEAFDGGGVCARPEIAGPGFLNFRLNPEWTARQLLALVGDARCGVPAAESPQRIIIDFSSPNIAKPMHVGHIRSTILGDTLARIARFLGHEVVTDNHLGDWGTQFGKVLYGWKHLLDRDALQRDPVGEMTRLYRDVNALEQSDPDVHRAARDELVKLQQGDPENRAIWNQLVELSWAEFQDIYDRLGVRFDERLGESFYDPALGPLVDKLLDAGIAQKSEGAVCVFFPEIPALADKPCLIRKSDGGFLYATTDLATIEYRVERWAPHAVWYVTGAPQQLHFQQVFAAAARMGIPTRLEHIAFGSILGEDHKLMKTRSGDNVPLRDLLDEAVARARAMIEDKNPELPDAEKDRISRIVGLGAVKYAELSQHRMTDYVFSWSKMLSLQGNTAPYLQNAYVRVRSIFRKLGTVPVEAKEVRFTEATELALAQKLLQFGEVVPLVLHEFRPNLLANHLFEAANAFHAFYEACPVLKAEGITRHSRLVLCDATAHVLKKGLDLLGVEVPERM